MFLHFASCPQWSDTASRCTCPRPWRIERYCPPGHRLEPPHPWTVLHRDNDSNTYEVFMRAATWQKAMSLVAAMLAFDVTKIGRRH